MVPQGGTELRDCAGRTQGTQTQAGLGQVLLHDQGARWFCIEVSGALARLLGRSARAPQSPLLAAPTEAQGEAGVGGRRCRAQQADGGRHLGD